MKQETVTKLNVLKVPTPEECAWKREPVCPHCGHVDEWWDQTLLQFAKDGDDRPHSCKWCNETYMVAVSMIPRFTTRKR